MKKIPTPLFQYITDEEWEEMCSCGCMRTTKYKKDSVIFHMGDTVDEIGIVISGNINIENVKIFEKVWDTQMLFFHFVKRVIYNIWVSQENFTFILTGKIFCAILLKELA